jgi:hypothetical protein
MKTRIYTVPNATDAQGDDIPKYREKFDSSQAYRLDSDTWLVAYTSEEPPHGEIQNESDASKVTPPEARRLIEDHGLKESMVRDKLEWNDERVSSIFGVDR